MKKPLTINEVLSLPAGDKDRPTWINCAAGRVLSVEKRQSREGKSYYSVSLGDDKDARVGLTMWAVPPFASGDWIEIGGSGTRLVEWQGAKLINTSQKTEFLVIPKKAAQPSAEKTAPTSSRPAAVGTAAPCGPTIGMAVKAAVEIALQNARLANVDLTVEELDGACEKYARAILCLTQRLEQPESVPVNAPSNASEEVPF